MAHTAPRYERCPHCAELRDTSGRYTSPANARRDLLDWRRDHLSGRCVDRVEPDPVQPHRHHASY